MQHFTWVVKDKGLQVENESKNTKVLVFKKTPYNKNIHSIHTQKAEWVPPADFSLPAEYTAPG